MHDKRRWIPFAIFTFLVAGVVLLLLPAVSGQPKVAPDDATSLKELRQEVADLRKKFDDLKKTTDGSSQNESWLSRTSPPVGTVVGFSGEWPPKKGEGGSWAEEEIGWMLCDGRKLPGTLYSELRTVLGTDALPDYRGYFLRGIDASIDGKTTSGRDKDGIRPVGKVQSFATALPIGNKFSTDEKGAWDPTVSGKNRHGADLHFNQLMAKTPRDEEFEKKKSPFFPPRFANTAKEGDYTVGEPDLFISGDIKPVPNHKHDIIGGDPETRPVNRAVYWIIKFK